jgi:hypothetical protein
MMSKVLLFALAFIAIALQVAAQQPQCPQGQLLFQGQCQPIRYVEGCATYLVDNRCQSCEYGYALSQGGCVKNGNECGDCCASYTQEGACLQCAGGLYSADPYCVRNEIYGCIVKQGDKCAVCGWGLSLLSGLCVPTIADCASYSQQGICTACNPHFQLIGSYCYAFPTVPNCNNHNEYGCIECQQGYFLTSKQTCQQYQPGCLDYWQEQCTACLPRFRLTGGVCLIEGCKDYNSDCCQQCQSGWQVVEGKCELNGCVRMVNSSCVQCRDGLRLTAQGCVQAAEYQCKSCASGLTFLNGACVKVIFGCLSYQNGSCCAQCASPFQLTVNGECQILGCQDYCQQGCTRCLAPFTLSNGLCSIDGCSNYDSKGCIACQSAYLLGAGACWPKDPNCAAYGPVSSKPLCRQCVDRFYLLNGTCRPADKGCSYDNNGVCTCKSNFTLKAGKCEIVGCCSYNW